MPRFRTYQFWLILTVILLVITLTSVALGLRPPQTAITRDNAAKVTKWMTVAQVEAILGGPSRDERSSATEPDHANVSESDFLDRAISLELDVTFMPGNQDGDFRPTTHTWKSDEVFVEVLFGPTDRVVEFVVIPVRRVSETPLTALRRRLGL
jgi:hypothetical protein